MGIRRWAAAAVLGLAAAAHAAPEPPAERLMPLEVTVNGAKGGTWLLLERRGVLYAPRDAFEEWRLPVPDNAERIDFKGQPYVTLAAIPGFKSRVDLSSQSAELLFSPEAFAASRLQRETVRKAEMSPVLPSVFINYDASYSTTSFRDAVRINDLGVLTEVGASTPWGVLTSSGVARNLASDRSLGEAHRRVRLETTFTRDFPKQNITVRVGDTTTRPTMFGREVYFGGIRVGTNFALTPGYVSQPLPVMSGLSAAPSTVEIYVNDVLRQVQSLPPGPFALDNLPAMVGNGEARMVVRDILGRETVITQSFFSASQLLAPGLDDWTIEAGAVRRDLGVVSDEYGPGFASGTWRRGISNTLTVEGRLEGARDNQLAGVSVISALPAQFLGRAAFAASHADTLGSGSLWLVGVERTGMKATASLQAQGATRNFRQLGEASEFTATRLQLAGNVSYTSDRLGTFGLGFASISRYDSDKVSTLTANYSVRVGERSNLTLNMSRAVDGVTGTAIGFTFVMPLEKNRIVTAVANSHGKTHDYYATAAQNSDSGTGLGWRALAGSVSERAHGEAGVYYLGRYAAISGDTSVSSVQNTVRVSASGGLVTADGRVFASRRVDQSFAIVEVPGHAGIGVGIGSNVVTRTDDNGIAIIPYLLPYQSNAVRIDPSELPVSAEIDNIERLAVPAWRSAVKVQFPVRTGRGALLRIVLDDGDVAPAGATVAIDGDNQEFSVARRGEAFVTGLQPVNKLTLKWQDQQCRFEVTLPPANAEEIARVGPLPCSGMKR